MKASKYQQAIYKFCKNPKGGSAIINAVAGSGKTTTAVEAIKCFPEGLDITFLAFNKAIAEELVERDVPAKTFHGLAYGPVMRYYGLSSVTVDKTNRIAKKLLPQFEYKKFQYAISKVVGLMKQVGATNNKLVEIAYGLIEQHDIDIGEDPDSFFRYLFDVYDAVIQNETMLDFDDLLYHAAMNPAITLHKFDVVFVDESQDTNYIQRLILNKISKPNTRIIAIGDRNQAIYGFRGADSQSMQNIQDDFKCDVLNLSVTYRCDKAIVEMAKQYVPQIEAREDAGPGLVKEQNDLTGVKTGDLVISRTTRELIKNAFALLREKKSVMVLGREIGQGLKTLINKMKAVDVADLMDKLENYKTREMSKFIQLEKFNQAQTVEDKVGAIQCLCESANSIQELLRNVDELFADKSKAIKFATIHKSKGLEAKRVFWLDFNYDFHWIKKDWMKEQENNLRYVAITRAKNELYLIPKRMK